MSKPINAFKHIEMPELLSLGQGMLKYLPEIVDKVALRGKGLLITDAFLRDKYAKEIEAIMEAEKREIIISVIEDSTLAEVDKQLQLFKEIDAGYAIGLGGGRPIDVAKLTSFKANKRFISIPTIASHDGLASSRASLKGVDKRHSIEARPPIAVVGDTDILDKAPYRFTVAGCGDVIAKKTAIKDWLLAHRLKNELISPTSISLAEMTVKLITENASLIKSQAEGFSRVVMNCLIASSLAMCTAGSSRPGSGSEHMFSHALDSIAKTPALHGEQTAFGTIMMSYLHNGIEGSDDVKTLMKTLGLPITAKELGVTAEEVVKALEAAHTIRKRFTILGFEGLSHEAATNVALKTGVIN